MSELRNAILDILNYHGERARLRSNVGTTRYERLLAALEADQPAPTETLANWVPTTTEQKAAAGKGGALQE